MKIEKDQATGKTLLIADDGMSIKRNDDFRSRNCVVKVLIPEWDSPDNWEDCELDDGSQPDDCIS